MPFFFSPTSVALAEDWGSYLLADQSKERYHRARYHPISARYRVLGVVPCPLFRLVRACLPGTGLSKTLPPRYQAWGEAPLRARKGLVPPSDTDTLVGAGRAPSSLSASVGRGPPGADDDTVFSSAHLPRSGYRDSAITRQHLCCAACPERERQRHRLCLSTHRHRACG